MELKKFIALYRKGTYYSFMFQSITKWITSETTTQKFWDNGWVVYFWNLYNFLNWSIVDLQYCISFRYTAKWFSYIYMCVFVCVYIHVYFRLFSTIGYYKILNIVPYTFWVLSTFLFKVHMGIFPPDTSSLSWSIFFPIFSL